MRLIVSKNGAWAINDCKGVYGIIHLATAAIFSTDPNEVIPPTVAGALSIFVTALLKRSIRSIVYTSDSFAALLPQPNQRVDVTALTYNEESVAVARDLVRAEQIRRAAWDPSTVYELNIYAAAKVAAERAIWQFVEDHKPSFQVAAILPNVNIGASIYRLPLSSTGTFIPKLLEGDTSALFFPAQHFIDVRDCARLHVAALLDPGQHKERIFAMAAPFNWNDVLGILRRMRPDTKIIDDMPNLGRDLSAVPNEAAERLLKRHYGLGWTTLEESVRQNIASL